MQRFSDPDHPALGPDLEPSPEHSRSSDLCKSTAGGIVDEILAGERPGIVLLQRAKGLRQLILGIVKFFKALEKVNSTSSKALSKSETARRPLKSSRLFIPFFQPDAPGLQSLLVTLQSCTVHLALLHNDLSASLSTQVIGPLQELITLLNRHVGNLEEYFSTETARVKIIRREAVSQATEFRRSLARYETAKRNPGRDDDPVLWAKEAISRVMEQVEAENALIRRRLACQSFSMELEAEIVRIMRKSFVKFDEIRKRTEMTFQIPFEPVAEVLPQISSEAEWDHLLSHQQSVLVPSTVSFHSTALEDLPFAEVKHEAAVPLKEGSCERLMREDVWKKCHIVVSRAGWLHEMAQVAIDNHTSPAPPFIANSNPKITTWTPPRLLGSKENAALRKRRPARPAHTALSLKLDSFVLSGPLELKHGISGRTTFAFNLYPKSSMRRALGEIKASRRFSVRSIGSASSNGHPLRRVRERIPERLSGSASSSPPGEEGPKGERHGGSRGVVGAGNAQEPSAGNEMGDPHPEKRHSAPPQPSQSPVKRFLGFARPGARKVEPIPELEVLSHGHTFGFSNQKEMMAWWKTLSWMVYDVDTAAEDRQVARLSPVPPRTSSLRHESRSALPSSSSEGDSSLATIRPEGRTNAAELYRRPLDEMSPLAVNGRARAGTRASSQGSGHTADSLGASIPSPTPTPTSSPQAHSWGPRSSSRQASERPFIVAAQSHLRRAFSEPEAASTSWIMTNDLDPSDGVATACGEEPQVPWVEGSSEHGSESDKGSDGEFVHRNPTGRNGHDKFLSHPPIRRDSVSASVLEFVRATEAANEEASTQLETIEEER